MDKTIAFVIPLKPERNSRNWALDSLFLTRTLKSILGQTCKELRVYVIYHDIPLNRMLHPSIEYVRMPFQYVEFDQIEDRHEQMERNSYLTERDVEYIFDQGRKQMFGAELAQKDGYEYIMSVDGDDLIEKQL